MAKRFGFRRRTSNDAVNDKLNEHYRAKHRKYLYVIVIAVAVLVVLRLWVMLGSYDNYTVRKSTEREVSSASHYIGFGGNILQYSNDGAVYMSSDGSLIWNQAYDMTSPKVDICKDYLVIYDQGGTEIDIMTADGLVKSIETVLSVRKVSVASQGTVAVLLKSDNDAVFKIFDAKGNELVDGESYASDSLIPVDIALSTDAQNMAVDMIDISSGSVNSIIRFYNFGSAGQSEVDNLVATQEMENQLIPEIKYLSAGTLLAVSDTGIHIFEGTANPKLSKEILIDKELESVFYNDEYVGVTYSNGDEENTHHIQVYNLKGKSVMENETSLSNAEVTLLSNNEICVRNSYACELYTIRSIKKFSYTFDTELYDFLYAGSHNEYIVIRSGAIEEVHLK